MLTKQQKIDFCNYAIAYYEDDPCEGMCSVFESYSGNFWANLYEEIPEIMKHKPRPKQHWLFWFPINAEGYVKRIQILKQVKEELLNTPEYAGI